MTGREANSLAIRLEISEAPTDSLLMLECKNRIMALEKIIEKVPTLEQEIIGLKEEKLKQPAQTSVIV